MSFTRFHDDPCRIEKQLQESTGPGRYMLNVPGNGPKPCFMEDPYIRLQKWGANLQTNTINLESELQGRTRKLTRDCQEYNANNVQSKKIEYQSCEPITNQSRVTHPAWLYKDLEQQNYAILPLDPQENTCIPFQNNLNTRLLERDFFKPRAPKCLFNEEGSVSTQPFNQHAGKTVMCNQMGTCGKL